MPLANWMIGLGILGFIIFLIPSMIIFFNLGRGQANKNQNLLWAMLIVGWSLVFLSLTFYE